jgi:hypothetical protein
MNRLRLLVLGSTFVFCPSLLVQCSSAEVPDGGTDAGTDVFHGNDASMDGGKDGTTMDVATSDVTTDVGTDANPADAMADSPADAPSDAVADAKTDAGDGGGFVVTSISGLVLWLDAAKGVTTSAGSITAWADQSGQSNNAAAGTATPTLVSSSINSLPAAHFVASSSQYVYVADATSLQFGTGDFYIAVVSKFDNDPTSGISTGIGAFYTKLGMGSGLLFFANDYDYSASTFAAGLCNLEDPTPTEVQYAATYNDGTARLYVVQRVSGTETLRVNASQVASSSSAIDVSESGAEVDIGLMSTSSAAALDGDIAEVVAISGTLSSTDRSNLESYLTSKYGL